MLRSADEHFITLEIDKEEIDNFDPDEFIEGYFDYYKSREDELEESYERELEDDEYRFRNRIGEYESWDDDAWGLDWW